MSITIIVSEDDMHGLYTYYLNMYNMIHPMYKADIDKMSYIHDKLNRHIWHYVLTAQAQIVLILNDRILLKNYNFYAGFIDYLQSVDISEYDPANCICV